MKCFCGPVPTIFQFLLLLGGGGREGGGCGEENHKMKPLAYLQNVVIHAQGTLMTCSCTLPEKQIGLVLWNPRAVCWHQL